MIDKEIVTPHIARIFLDKILYQKLHPVPPKNRTKAKRRKAARKINDSVDKSIKAATSKLEQLLKADKHFEAEYKLHYDNWAMLYEFKTERGFIEQTADMEENAVSDMDLAIATYVVFQQSRDGMGKAFSKGKFRTNDQYRKQIVKLFDCAERLEGVEIFQIDAVDFFGL